MGGVFGTGAGHGHVRIQGAASNVCYANGPPPGFRPVVGGPPFYGSPGSNAAGGYYIAPGPAATVEGYGYITDPYSPPGSPKQGGRRGCNRVMIVGVLVTSVLFFAAAYLLWQRITNPPPPAWIVDLATQVGDENAAARGKMHTPQRAVVEQIFGGTHVKGYPPGHPHGDMFILQHAGEKIPGQFGPVVLSQNAQWLRTALIQRGFVAKKVYHGTENPFIPSILTGGFLNSDGMLGLGIYTASTFAHAQCYAPGEGEPILELEAYWRDDDNSSRYIVHKQHQSTANDVQIVSDPLLIYPVQVLKCCPEPLPCMR